MVKYHISKWVPWLFYGHKTLFLGRVVIKHSILIKSTLRGISVDPVNEWSKCKIIEILNAPTFMEWDLIWINKKWCHYFDWFGYLLEVGQMRTHRRWVDLGVSWICHWSIECEVMKILSRAKLLWSEIWLYS